MHVYSSLCIFTPIFKGELKWLHLGVLLPVYDYNKLCPICYFYHCLYRISMPLGDKKSVAFATKRERCLRLKTRNFFSSDSDKNNEL